MLFELDDGIRPSFGVLVSLLNLGRGQIRLIMDDVRSQSPVRANERVIALDPDPRGVQCRPTPATPGPDPFRSFANGSFAKMTSLPLDRIACSDGYGAVTTL